MRTLLRLRRCDCQCEAVRAHDQRWTACISTDPVSNACIQKYVHSWKGSFADPVQMFRWESAGILVDDAVVIPTTGYSIQTCASYPIGQYIV